MTDVILSEGDYSDALSDVVALLEEGRRAAARCINALMTATYWLIGRRIVESEQGVEGRAAYGQALLQRLSPDLTRRPRQNPNRRFGICRSSSWLSAFPCPGRIMSG
jgi:hypothetical protein